MKRQMAPANSETATGGECRLSADTLRRAFPFISDEDAVSLCRYLEPRDWPAGTQVIEKNEPGDYMGFLVKGKLVVKKETSFADKYVLVAILERGSMFGEIAVVEDGTTRNATVVAVEDSQALILTRVAMDCLLVENPPLGAKVLKRIIQVLSQRLKKASDRLARLL